MSQPSTPWWARALTGAIVGLLASVVLCALVAAVALVLTFVSPGLGVPRIWRAAAAVMILTTIAGVARSVWRSVAGPPRSPPPLRSPPRDAPGRTTSDPATARHAPGR